ncbi:MAG: DNA-binding NtrC family response regulator [Planctomycetota bacterium]|jgi:DNA-binding NtrC family response regulator
MLSMSLSFLIVLSDEAQARTFALSIEAQGHRAQAAPDAAAAASALGKGPVDACLLGVDLPERLSLARALADRGKLVVLVGDQRLNGDEPELLGGLAWDQFNPDEGPKGLQAMLRRVTRLRQVLSEREELRAARLAPLDDLLGGSAPATMRLRAEVERVARTPRTTVLIQGEAGTRKDLLARGIHGRSDRRRAPFRTLLGDGIRTSSFSHHLGELLASTSGGTLVVQEVASLDLAQQRILASLLAEPQGDVRFIATTSVNLEALAIQGRFSEDLLYRLNVLTIDVPSLRERREDLPSLAHALVARHAPSGSTACALSLRAEQALLSHEWPGNLRELEAALIRATHNARGGTIHPGHLGMAADSPMNGDGTPSLELGDRSIQTMEQALIRRVLEDEGGNRSRAARILGINRSTLYNKLKQYSID